MKEVPRKKNSPFTEGANQLQNCEKLHRKTTNFSGVPSFGVFGLFRPLCLSLLRPLFPNLFPASCLNLPLSHPKELFQEFLPMGQWSSVASLALGSLKGLFREGCQCSKNPTSETKKRIKCFLRLEIALSRA